MNARRAWRAAAAVVCLLLLFACPWAGAERSVRVAVYDSPPKVQLRRDGPPQGLFIELLEAIARRQDWRIEYVPGTFDEALARLDAREVDLMADLMRLPQRDGRFSFNAERVIDSWAEVYARDDQDVRSILDLAGKRVAVLQGSIQQELFARLAADFGVRPTMLAYPDYASAFAAVARGQADAVLGVSTHRRLAAGYPGVVETAVIFAPAPLHYAAPAGASADLLAAIDHDLRFMKADATSPYFAALARWLSFDRERIPAWIKWGLGAAAVLAVLGVGWALTLLRARNRVRRSEAAQRRAAEELQHVFEHSLDVIAVLDEDLRIERVSPACGRLWGIAPEQCIGRLPFEFVPARDREALCRTIGAIRDGLANASFETRATAADGSRRCVVWSGVWSDTHRRMYCVGRDDTQRRELLDTLELHGLQLQQANEDLRSFSQSVSHDLRAPLAAIKGFVGKALHDSRDGMGERSVLLLEKALAAEDRMEHLIADLLRFARISDHGLERRACDLAAIAGEVVAALREASPASTAQVTVAPGLWATADPQLMRVVLDNLLGNAWKFSAQVAAPAIDVGQERVDGEAVFFVRDNGAGFDMNYAHQLFQPFQRLHRASEFDGLGIGLSIASRIVKRHGGRIWGDSTPGRGAVFRFTLGRPGAECAPAATADRSRRAAVPA